MNWIPFWRAAGFDAVLVASTWQWILSTGLPETVRAPLLISTAGSVWCLYSLDRIWDGSRLRSGTGSQPPLRHTSAWKWRFALIAFAIAGMLAAVISAWHLPLPAFLSGMGIAALCGVYYFVRVRKPFWDRGRELAVGGIFALGIILPAAFCKGFANGTAWMTIGLAALFSANVRFCIRVEKCLLPTSDWKCLVSLLLSGLAFLGFWLSKPVTHMGVLQPWLIGLACCLGLYIAMRFSRRQNPETAGALADSVLWIVPAVFLILQTK